jgi:hypothetical protein
MSESANRTKIENAVSHSELTRYASRLFRLPRVQPKADMNGVVTI